MNRSTLTQALKSAKQKARKWAAKEAFYTTDYSRWRGRRPRPQQRGNWSFYVFPPGKVMTYKNRNFMEARYLVARRAPIGATVSLVNSPRFGKSKNKSGKLSRVDPGTVDKPGGTSGRSKQRKGHTA